MYMKAVFNCYNELIIEAKSQKTFVNGRSSIGPGELTLSVKEYNSQCDREGAERVLLRARERLLKLVGLKCCMP